MVDSENIKEVVNQAAVQAVIAVMMPLRDTETGPQPTTVMSHKEPHRQRHNGLILINQVFNWGAQDRYI